MTPRHFMERTCLVLTTLAAGCASTHAAAPPAPPAPPVVTAREPARPPPDDGPLRGAVTSVAARVDLLQRELSEARQAPSALTAAARDLFFGELRDEARVARARLDASRPLRSWYGPIDAPVAERLEALRALGRAHVAAPSPERDMAAESDRAPRPDDSPDATRWRALHAQCPAGGFAQRIVWPSLEPEVTARVFDASLDASRWARLPASSGFDALRRWNHHAIALGVSHTRDQVVIDVWIEPLEGCQGADDRRAFEARAVERLYGLRAAETGAAPVADDERYVLQTRSLDEARRAFALGVVNIDSAVGFQNPDEAPIIDPAVIPGLVLGGLHEADSALRLVGDGAYTTDTRLALRHDARGDSLTVQGELGADASAFPAEGLWGDGPSISAVGAREVLDVRAAWLSGFGPARDSDAWTTLRRQAGLSGAALAPLHEVAASLRFALGAAQPTGAPWPAADRVDRELAVTVAAPAAGAPAARVHIALLAANTTAAAAACALAPSPAACGPVRLTVGAPRVAPGGFARLIAVGARFAVAVGASRAAVASIALRDVAAAAPCVGVISAEQLGVDLRGFMHGAVGVEFAREGARITARLRSDVTN